METDIYDREMLNMESIILDDSKLKEMISSTTSSLTSPVDSGVQLLDSESDQTSVMSASGFDLEKDPEMQITDCEKLNEMFSSLVAHEKQEEPHVMTKSDIANQNVTDEQAAVSEPVGEKEEKFMDELRPEDLMNVSLNSYELLDYTLANKCVVKSIEEDQMHVSMSEEVNESLQALKISTDTDVPPIESNVEEVKPVIAETVPDEQIVFRRQRKKKSRSDTPKKRVSFHEDILNSTKIDDIHINHGFITIEPDVSSSFFLRGFSKKPDVVKGRYSWAAEGDAPYYDKKKSDREVKSDIYIHTARFSSSSSSSGSISSSIDEEDAKDDEEIMVKKEPVTLKMPKSSCLKKTKHRSLDTNIVEEEMLSRRKKSESNLLDSNIFGSLKNILNFSTSVPLAERGVPEGQEDVTIYSSSHDSCKMNKSNLENIEPIAPVKKVGNLNLEARSNLRLSIHEDFQPNVSKIENVPANILLCDSNVYEHKGISYSYEYDTFQKSFINQKPKSSTVYQMILKEFNFFRRKAKQNPEPDAEDFEILNASTPVKEKETLPPDSPPNEMINSYASSTKMDWSDSDTASDFHDCHTRHLHSPKKKIARVNHYAVQNFRPDGSEVEAASSHQSKSLPVLRGSSSKNSLINRFLRNVTVKKMLDLKSQKKLKTSRRYMGLYVEGARPNRELSRKLDKEIEEEIVGYKKSRDERQSKGEVMLTSRLRKDIFRDEKEELIKVFPVMSAYTTSGEHKPLIVALTNTTFYIAGLRQNYGYCNHFVLPYTELNTLLIGPNAHTIHVSNIDNDMQCIITTGCGNITNNIIVNLEIAMRRDNNKPRLPAVKQLNMRDMVNLRRIICKQTAVQNDEEYFYYSTVNLQEYNTDQMETPLGPNKEGPLMFKISDSESRWETAYFILKAGVLYMLSSPTYRVPMRVLPLINGACQGARRVYNCPRPHTFQLIIAGNTFHLAAPDEYVASDWLQALVHAASGTYNPREKLVTQACTLLMTNDHILTVREAFPCNIVPSRMGHDPIKGAQALSCASISDITSFRLPSAEQSWCILEFACREVHESSGDWILYFNTNSELENFISTLEMLWAYHNEGDSFPISMLSESDNLNKRCMETYKVLQNYWPHITKV